MSAAKASSCEALFKKGDALGASICLVKKVCADCRITTKPTSNIKVIHSTDRINEIEVINQTKAHAGDIEFTGSFRLTSIYQNESALELSFMKNATLSAMGIPIKSEGLRLRTTDGRALPIAFPPLLFKLVDKKKISIRDIERTAGQESKWLVITVVAEKPLVVCGISLPTGSQIGAHPISDDLELEAAPTGPVTVDGTVYEPGTHDLQLTDRSKCNVRLLESTEGSRSW